MLILSLLLETQWNTIEIRFTVTQRGVFKKGENFWNTVTEVFI